MEEHATSQISNFQDWFHKNLGRLHQDLIIEQSIFGTRAILDSTASQLRSGTRVVTCPHELTISFVNAQQTFLSILSIATDPACRNAVGLLALFLVLEYEKGQHSFWWPYLSILPKPDDDNAFDTPIWCGASELEFLQGTNLASAARVREDSWRLHFEASMRYLSSHGETRHQAWKWRDYCWASTIIMSRAFPNLGYKLDERNTHVLIPGLDLLNHSPLAKVSWERSNQECCITIEEDVRPGCELFNNYGPKSNEELLLAYGFCIKDNPVELFNLGFSKASTDKINSVKLARGLDNAVLGPKPSSVLSEDNETGVFDQHYVRINRTSQDAPPEFSTSFLAHFSIMLETKREQIGPHNGWSFAQTTISREDLNHMNRNRLNVISALIMLLEKSLKQIRQHDHIVPREPCNMRQTYAVMYRSGQIDTLDRTIKHLYAMLDHFIAGAPGNGILTLKHILSIGPHHVTKGLQSILRAAFGSSKVTAIVEADGEECAFTLWLFIRCNLLAADETDPLANRISSWLRLLRADSISESSLSGSTNVKRPSQTDEEDLAIVHSYKELITAWAENHPDSTLRLTHDNDEDMLLWCLHVVRREGFHCAMPSTTSETEEERDQFILFLDEDATMIR